MTSQESMRHTIRPGYWMVNVAPLGSDPDWREEAKPPDVDPNKPQTLFGYEEKELLRKQYK